MMAGLIPVSLNSQLTKPGLISKIAIGFSGDLRGIIGHCI